MSNSVVFGERLFNERKRLGLNQAQLGTLLGVGKAMVSLIEKGSSSLDTARLIGLGEHGFDLNYLIQGERIELTAAKALDWPFALEVDQKVRDWAAKRGLELSVAKRAQIVRHFVLKAAIGAYADDDLEMALSIAA